MYHNNFDEIKTIIKNSAKRDIPTVGVVIIRGGCIT